MPHKVHNFCSGLRGKGWGCWEHDGESWPLALDPSRRQGEPLDHPRSLLRPPEISPPHLSPPHLSPPHLSPPHLSHRSKPTSPARRRVRVPLGPLLRRAPLRRAARAGAPRPPHRRRLLHAAPDPARCSRDVAERDAAPDPARCSRGEARHGAASSPLQAHDWHGARNLLGTL